MQIAKLAACQIFAANRRDNRTLIVTDKSYTVLMIEKKVSFQTERLEMANSFLTIVVIFRNY